jgi:hypothetical protein
LIIADRRPKSSGLTQFITTARNCGKRTAADHETKKGRKHEKKKKNDEMSVSPSYTV